jgi:hypothetical protein
MWRPVVLGFLSLVLLVAAKPAAADGWHRHGCCSGTRVFLGFNFAAPAYGYGYGYPYYYAPPPAVVYQAPPPVAYYQAPYQAPQAGIALGRDVGQGCREYTAPVTVGGRVVQGYGIACPRPDGTWQIVQ